MTGYWLFHTDPAKRSWDDVVKQSAEGLEWNGVRDDDGFDALASMRKGDLAVIYHAGDDRRLVGIAKLLRPAHADKSDDSGRWLSVDVYAFIRLINPVDLDAVRDEPRLAGMLLAEGDTSEIQPVDEPHWRVLCELAGMPRTIERG